MSGLGRIAVRDRVATVYASSRGDLCTMEPTNHENIKSYSDS